MTLRDCAVEEYLYACEFERAEDYCSACKKFGIAAEIYNMDGDNSKKEYCVMRGVKCLGRLMSKYTGGNWTNKVLDAASYLVTALRVDTK